MNKILVFNDVEVNKKDFYDVKKAIPLNVVSVNNIVKIKIKLKIIMRQVNILLVIYMMLTQLVHCASCYHK